MTYVAWEIFYVYVAGTHVYRLVHTCIAVCLSRGPSRLLFLGAINLIFKNRSLIGLELSEEARLTCQYTSGILLSLPSQYCSRHREGCSCFYLKSSFCGIEHRHSCLRVKHFTGLSCRLNSHGPETCLASAALVKTMGATSGWA